MKSQMWLVRVADSAQDSAKRILETDLEQLIMIVTTIVGAVTYGWIEGAIIAPGCIGRVCDWAGPQGWWLLGHFSTYSAAMMILFACVTGGLGLIKARSMFAKGRRYFLFTFTGNMPMCAMLEDFTYFFFNASFTGPEYRLNSGSWTNWFLGGIWVIDPWRQGVRLWIPTWYGLVLAFWLAMMWIAHSCTVYDNLVKDEISKQLIPTHADVPKNIDETGSKSQPSPQEKMETNTPQPVAPPESESSPSSSRVGETKRQETQEASTSKQASPTKTTELHPASTIEAEEALRKLRARIMKKDAQ